MPLRSSWPTSGDLLRYLEAAGLTVPATLTGLLATAIDAAGRDFESAQGAGRTILADASDVTRRFDPPTDRESLLFIPDLATVTSVQYQPNGAAETWTANTDYWLEPYDAQSDSRTPRPYTRLRCSRRWYQPLSGSTRRSILITGKWGYATTVPDDVWLAVLARGGVNLHAVIAQSVTGGVVRWSDADASEQYGDKPLAALKDGWEAQFQMVAQAYRRLTF